MEKNITNNMEMYEQYIVKYNKVNIIAMVSGLMWVVLVLTLTAHRNLILLSAMLFSLPHYFAMKYEDKDIYKYKIRLLILIAVTLSATLVVSRVFPGKVFMGLFGIMAMIIFIYVFAFSIRHKKQMRDYASCENADERVKIILLKSELMGLRIFVVLITLMAVGIDFFGFYPTAMEYLGFILMGLFVFSGVTSITFLKMNSSN